MKKWCTVLLMLVLVGTMVGCGQEQATSAKPSVTIQIPREIINIDTDEEIVDIAQEQGMEAHVKDGIVTYKMTPEQQQDLLLSYKTAFEEQLAEAMDEGAIPGMLEVSYNDMMSEFSVVVDAEIFDITMNGMGLGMFYSTGMGYQLYAGIPEEEIDVHVTIINRENKKELGQFSMRDVFAKQQAPGDMSD